MASLQMNKLKSKLTTRNQFTGRAMERMTKDTLRELFQGDLNYMSWEKTYIQRRFHSDEYVRQLREHRREAFEKQKKQTNTSATEASELERILAEEEKHDDELQTRFQRFEQIHNGGDKTVLILDVDNTMVYVRFFSEEIEVGDVVTYFASSAVHKNNATVVAIRLTLILEIASSTLIDTIGAERLEHEYWATSNEALRKYKKKNGVFDYAHDAQSFACKIRKVEVTGCRLQLRVDDDDDEAVDDGDGAVEVDFTGTENVENLSRLEPMLERAGMSPVDFIYEGFLVRVRPNLDEFLEYCSDDYDVVIYTSANKLIYEGLLQVLHDYLVDQLGRDDESELRLWTDVLYRDDCTLDYDERGKPYHHKDLTLFGADLSRVIMVDNSPVVCRGEEPNLLLIRDYFGKDALDDELMELYQILDAMLDIEGDVRYFLCGLLQSSQAQQAVDTSTEEACWALTQQLMSALDAYYSQQIAFVGDGDEDGDAQVVDEGDDAMMDDYDEEDISQREKMFAQARVQQHKTQQKSETATQTQTQSETVAARMDVVDGAHKQLVVPPATLTLQHETSASVTVTAVDLDAGVEMDEMDVDIGDDDDDDETDNDGSRPATTTAVSAASDTKTRKSVKFELPSLDTNAAANATLTLAQKGKSKSAKSSRSKSSRSKLSMSRHMSAHSSHTHNHSLRKSASRNKSLLLDPDKLTTATLSKRHAHYSSMSPKYAIWSFAHATKGYGPKLSDLDVNDAIHSFGAHDDDDDDDDEEQQDPEMEVVREHHEQFFAKTANHAHTKSSLTIDAKLYSTRTSTNMRVPMFKVDLASDVLAMTKSESAQISPTLTATADGSGDKEDSVSTTMSLNHHQHKLNHSSGAASGMSDLDSDFFVPAANILKRSSMRTVHTIKAEQAQKRQKRLSQKHLFGHKQQQPQPQTQLLPMKQLVDARLRPLESYEHDKEPHPPQQPQPQQHLQPNTSRQKSVHRRAISSDAIQEVDFSAMEMSASATGTPTMTAMTATTERGGGGRRRPRQAARPGRHKHSIHDTEQFGRIWKNTMAPRPSANAILLQSKHDEFIMLFQQQLAENKQQQLQRKQSHVRQAEKRNSVPDFAIFASLSEMESEADVTAHRERLSTLREEQLSGGAFGQSNTLQSLSEQVPQAQRTLSSRKEYASRFSSTMSSKHKLLDSQTETKDLMHMERLRTDTNTHRNHPHSNQEINATTTQWNENISSHHGCCYYLFCCCVCNLLCGRAPTHESSDTLDENLAHAPASLDLSQE